MAITTALEVGNASGTQHQSGGALVTIAKPLTLGMEQVDFLARVTRQGVDGKVTCQPIALGWRADAACGRPRSLATQPDGTIQRGSAARVRPEQTGHHALASRGQQFRRERPDPLTTLQFMLERAFAVGNGGLVESNRFGAHGGREGSRARRRQDDS
jgi:hypothetical protein